MQVVSATDVWVAAGPVGALDINGFAYHSADGGKTWQQHKLPEMGMIMAGRVTASANGPQTEMAPPEVSVLWGGCG